MLNSYKNVNLYHSIDFKENKIKKLNSRVKELEINQKKMLSVLIQNYKNLVRFECGICTEDCECEILDTKKVIELITGRSIKQILQEFE